MPQKVFCERCGTVLYNDLELRPPDEIIQQLDAKCPGCGKKLEFASNRVEIKLATSGKRA